MKAQNSHFGKYEFTERNKKLLYRFSYPDNYDSTKKYPLILFLHGAGERGNDNEKQLTYIDKYFENEYFRRAYPAFILVPQCPKDKRWVEVSWSLPAHTIPEKISEPLGLTMDLLFKLIDSLPIDTNRIYITGLSMGGFGVWDAIARYPNLFAAAVPICGGADLNTAKKIKDIPIWVFHGSEDKVVTVERSRKMVAELKKYGSNVKYTEFPKTGHLSWNKAYATPGLWDWMFEQSKKKLNRKWHKKNLTKAKRVFLRRLAVQ